jgi:hypothetical protein
MWDEYTSELPESNKYGVKITEAGRFFTYIQCDFEYFACRYAKNDTPLLLIRDLNTIKETIECVFNKAKECIDYVILQEYQFTNQNFRALDNRNYHYLNEDVERPLPCRIIDNHWHYLLQYREIVKQKGGTYLNTSMADDEDLLAHIETYAQKYKNIQIQIKENNYTVNGIPEKVKNYIGPDYRWLL